MAIEDVNDVCLTINSIFFHNNHRAECVDIINYS